MNHVSQIAKLITEDPDVINENEEAHRCAWCRNATTNKSGVCDSDVCRYYEKSEDSPALKRALYIAMRQADDDEWVDPEERRKLMLQIAKYSQEESTRPPLPPHLR